MPCPFTNRRAAFTLLELLIVITILAMLSAVAISRVLPAMSDRKTRELSRQLNAFFAGAKARAAERGRPAGVWFERSKNNANECLEVFFAEPAGVYTGDTLYEKATFTAPTMSSPWQVQFGGSPTLTMAGSGLVQDGEWVMARFNHQGGFYKCIKVAGSSKFNFQETPPPVVVNNPSLQLSFEVILPPRKSAVSPLDVPNGLAIDLSSSGIGATGRHFATTSPNDSTPVIVMFSSTGEVIDIYNNGTPVSEYGTVHFLIGENDTRPHPSSTSLPPSPSPTVQSLISFWISVGVRTGSITTAENNWKATWTPSSPPAGYLATCREFALSTQTKGGG